MQLKRYQRGKQRSQRRVAPLAGAWIETLAYQRLGMSLDVAPLAGAWIETEGKVVRRYNHPSRAPRGRVD